MLAHILEMRGISKSFGSNLANDQVSLTLNQGEILAVIGENGAGKSTLMKILYGSYQPDAGEIRLRGKVVTIGSTREAMALHIGMVQQHFMLLPSRTVAENVVYGREPRSHGIFFDRRQAVEDCLALSEKYRLAIDPNQQVGSLAVGLQQRVEILKVLYQDADIIIFDEPTAVLTPQESDALFKTMRELAEAGKSLIIITHKLNEVMAVADRVMVMRSGRYIKEKEVGETSIEELSYLMIGKQLEENSLPPRRAGRPILEVEDLCLQGQAAKPILDGISLHVDEGEIVGIAGVSGNGQSELIHCLSGIRPPSSGSIRLQGKEISGKSVGEIRKAGISHIPEDRFYWGCAREGDLVETAIMGHLDKHGLSKHGILDGKKSRDFTRTLVKEYDVRASSLDQKAGQLSGGNLQKLIAAREIEQHSPLLIAAEPSRGVDIGAMEYIHQQLIRKRNANEAVLLLSSELSEIFKLSDRIYVIFDGRIVGEFTADQLDERAVGLLMTRGRMHA